MKRPAADVCSGDGDNDTSATTQHNAKTAAAVDAFRVGLQFRRIFRRQNKAQGFSDKGEKECT